MMLLPVTIARFIAFGGDPVPFWATIMADFIFNLQGLVNVLLLLSTRRLIPDTAVLPMFTRRKSIDLSSPEAYGITPFALPAPTEAEKPIPPLPNDATIVTSGLGRVDTTASVSTSSSVDSQTPMLQCLERPEFSLRT
ncbi:hypothetical protein AcW1_001624 [Taiwanofungus camphoratus]|nr:hypothetical protein AcV5_000333 [Antrodia cinnamomea]KAI0945389.1 hypothetical protein AcW1_001624 [Antrodia cinnamomea]